MFKNRANGVELSMNTIIIAALGLLVLVLLAIFLMNGFGKSNTATKCTTLSGTCMTGSCSGDTPVPTPWSCDTKGQVCCTKIGGG